MKVKEFVLDNKPGHLTVISTNPLDDSPIKTVFLHAVPNGTLLEHEDVLKNGTPITEYNYKNHPYEHVVILSVGPAKIFAYGTKIGEQLIPFGNPKKASVTRGLNRGDELLIKQTEEGFQIIHNITHEIIKANLNYRYRH